MQRVRGIRPRRPMLRGVGLNGSRIPIPAHFIYISAHVVKANAIWKLCLYIMYLAAAVGFTPSVVRDLSFSWRSTIFVRGKIWTAATRKVFPLRLGGKTVAIGRPVAFWRGCHCRYAFPCAASRFGSLCPPFRVRSIRKRACERLAAGLPALTLKKQMYCTMPENLRKFFTIFPKKR